MAEKKKGLLDRIGDVLDGDDREKRPTRKLPGKAAPATKRQRGSPNTRNKVRGGGSLASPDHENGVAVTEMQAAPSTPSRTYIVVAGDTLSHIAQRYYGNAAQWQRIYQANRDKLSNPDLIHPGQELVIPE